MKYTFTGKDFNVSNLLREKIMGEMNFLNKYFIIDDSTECHVTISLEKDIHKVEIMVFSKAGLLRNEVSDKDLNKALEIILEKLDSQISKNKQRLNRKKRTALVEAFFEDGEPVNSDEILVRTKSISPEPMDLEEAILQMEMLGHSFFIYLDQENEKYAVVYRRVKGGYGLIEIDD